MFKKRQAYFIEASGGSTEPRHDQSSSLTEDDAGLPNLSESKNAAGVFLKPTIISEGFELIGQIRAACHVAIDGVVRGTISAPTVNVGTKAYIDASVHCENMTIKGQFSGTLDCTNLTVVTDAVADGELNFETITIQRGGIVKGSLKKKQLTKSLSR